jgi:hypothetical protein
MAAVTKNRTNAVVCFDQKLCALEQHLYLRINEIKAEFIMQTRGSQEPV